MTILNVRLWPTRALIITDTASDQAGSRVEASKLSVFPHLPAVVAGRGSLVIRLALSNGFAEATDFEHGLSTTETYADQVIKSYAALYTEASLVHEIVMVGWSTKTASIRSFSFNAAEGPAATEMRNASWCAPWDKSLEAMRFDTVADGIALAKEQYRLHLDRPGFVAGVGCGGRLLATEISQFGVKTEIVADLDRDITYPNSFDRPRVSPFGAGVTLGRQGTSP